MEPTLFKKIEEAPSVDFGSILSRSFDLVKKVWQQGLMHALIAAVLAVPLILLIYIPLIPFYAQSFSRRSYYYDDYYGGGGFFEHPVLFIVLYFLIILVVAFLSQTLSYGLACHFYRILRQEDTGVPEETNGYFHYLRGKHLGRIFVLSITAFGIAILATLLCYLPIFYVSVPLQLFMVIFAFNDELTVKEVIRASFRLGHKYWPILFALILISGAIAQIGIIVCVIGVIATAYFVHLPIYYFYKDTIGFDSELPQN